MGSEYYREREIWRRQTHVTFFLLKVHPLCKIPAAIWWSKNHKNMLAWMSLRQSIDVHVNNHASHPFGFIFDSCTVESTSKMVVYERIMLSCLSLWVGSPSILSHNIIQLLGCVPTRIMNSKSIVNKVGIVMIVLLWTIFSVNNTCMNTVSC